VLSEDNVRALESINFDWGKTHRSRWDEKYNELVAFHAVHGHTNVPARISRPLCVWVHAQRAQYDLFLSKQPSFMTLERIQKLLGVGFQFARSGRKSSECVSSG
jgi:hypothetical protein